MRESDGRLDLDDLGAVIDHAAPLDLAPSGEVLEDGRGRTLGERLHDAGVTPWLHRHRVAIGSVATAVVVLGVGATAVVRSRPPELDPTLRVTASAITPTSFTDNGNSQQFDGPGIYPVGSGVMGPSAGGPLRAAYALTPEQDDDASTYSVVGFVGPGVRTSLARPHAQPTTDQPVAADVDVVLDCEDSAALEPAYGSYHLVVRRTDSIGRTVTGKVDLPDGGLEWPGYVAATCLQARVQTAFTVRSVTARAIPVDRSVALEVALSNTLQVPVSVSSQQNGGFPAVSPELATTRLPPSSDAVLAIRLAVRSCDAPTSANIGVTDYAASRGYETTTAPGMYVAVDGTTNGLVGQASGLLRWTPAQAAQIDDALAATCAGAPTFAARLTSVTPGRPTVGGVVTVPDSNASLVTTFTVATPGERVRISSPVLPLDQIPPSTFVPVVARVESGKAVVSTAWNVDCSNGYVEPPWLRVLVTTPRGTFPFQTQITSGRLGAALTAQCPALTSDQLSSFGWETVPSSTAAP